MAEVITARDVRVKRRKPWGVWALNLATLGIHSVVHWERINAELRDYSAAAGRPFRNRPELSALALLPGFLLIVPPLVTIARTTRRIRRLQHLTASWGIALNEVHEPQAIALALLGGSHVVYLQTALNECWDRAEVAETAPPPARRIVEPLSRVPSH